MGGEQRPVGLVVRPRLLEALTERWQRPICGVVGGPGSGKTTLLTQAITENRLSSHGRDVFIACQPGDTDRELQRRAAAALLDVSSPTVPLAEAIAAAAPVPVAVLFDDVHVIADADRTALAESVARLPANAHVVLVSRGSLPESVPVLLDESALYFTDDELDTAVGNDPDLRRRLAATHGWPALVSHVLFGGSGDVGEVGVRMTADMLDALEPDERRVIGALASVGPLAPDLLEAAGLHDLVARDVEAVLGRAFRHLTEYRVDGAVRGGHGAHPAPAGSAVAQRAHRAWSER